MPRTTRRLVLACALTCLGAAAAAQNAAQDAAPATRLAILSLLGDKVHVVVFSPTTGSHLDTNRQGEIPLADRTFDRVALAAVAAATKAIDPNPALLTAPDPSLYDEPPEVSKSERIALPPAVVAALQAAGAHKLILVTKRRGAAQLGMAQGTVGEGKLQGLGFYLDGYKKIRRSDTGMTGVGFIAPYLYANVSVVDVATLTVESTVPVQTGYVVSSARNESGTDAWGALTPEQKPQALQRLIRKHLPAAASKAAMDSGLAR